MNSIVYLYNHLRFLGVGNEQTSIWINTDLELIPQPGFIKRFITSDTDTKVTSVLERLSAEISTIKNKSLKSCGDFVLGVLKIRSQKKDHNFSLLSRINVARYILSRADSSVGNFEPLRVQYEALERRYMLGEKVKPAELQTLISAIKTLPLYCWANLVPDVLMRVFEYLPVIDLANAAKVNQHWHEYAQSAWHRAKRVPTVFLCSLARNYEALHLQYVAQCQLDIQAFSQKPLVSKKVCDLTLSGTIFQDAPHKFASDKNVCVVSDNNTLIIIKTDPVTKVQTKLELKNCTAQPLVYRDEVYLTYYSPVGAKSLYLARVDVATGVREVLYHNVLLHPECVSLYKSKAYFALSNNRVVTVDLDTRDVSQTSEPFQNHLYKYLCFDRYIYSDQQTDLRVKNLSDPAAADITLLETVGATVLSATPGLVAVIIPNALQVAVFSLKTGEKMFSCPSDRLGAVRATIHRGMLFLEYGNFELKVIDLSSKEIVKIEKFKVPSLCHPYLDKIFYTTYPDFGWGPDALQQIG